MNLKKILQTATLALVCMLGLTACDPQVYGSVGVSSGWSNYGGSSMRGSVSVSGRVCC